MMKLARIVQQGSESQEPLDLIAKWRERGSEVLEWALSEAAAGAQLIDMDDAPAKWLRLLGEVEGAWQDGVDFTKVKSYDNMLQAVKMLRRGRGEEATNANAKASAEATPEPAPEPEAEPEVEPEAEPEAEPEGEPEAEPEAEPPTLVEEAEEAELTDEEVKMAATLVDRMLESGQPLDPDTILFVPVKLIVPIQQFNELSEGKQELVIKGITNLTKAHYDNHVKELQEGERRKQKPAVETLTKAQLKKKRKQDAINEAAKKRREEAAAAKLKDPTQKAKAPEAAPPKRGGGFTDKFAALMDKNKA